MDKQERDEVAELVLRAVRLNFDAGVLHATRGTSVEALMLAEENAHTAQREVWEALFRIRLDLPQEAQERASGAHVHVLGTSYNDGSA